MSRPNFSAPRAPGATPSPPNFPSVATVRLNPSNFPERATWPPSLVQFFDPGGRHFPYFTRSPLPKAEICGLILFSRIFHHSAGVAFRPRSTILPGSLCSSYSHNSSPGNRSSPCTQPWCRFFSSHPLVGGGGQPDMFRIFPCTFELFAIFLPSCMFPVFVIV